MYVIEQTFFMVDQDDHHVVTLNQVHTHMKQPYSQPHGHMNTINTYHVATYNPFVPEVY